MPQIDPDISKEDFRAAFKDLIVWMHNYREHFGAINSVEEKSRLICTFFNRYNVSDDYLECVRDLIEITF